MARELELPYPNPKTGAEVRANLLAMEKYYKKRTEELLSAHPELRKQARDELRSIVSKLESLISEINKFESQYFLRERRKIAKIGYAGRAINTEFALSYLEYGLGFLKRVLNSLTRGGEQE